MNLVKPLIFALFLGLSRQSDGPASAEELLKHFPSYSLPKSGFKWFKDPGTDWHRLPVYKRGFETSKPVTMRARKVENPDVREKTLRSLAIQEKMRDPDSIAKILQKEEFDGWIYVILDVEILGLITARSANFHLNAAEGSPNFLIEIKNLMVGMNHLHGKGYVLANLNINQVFLQDRGDVIAATLLDFEQAVPVNSPINEAGDFRYWEPTRLAGEESSFKKTSDLYAFGVFLYAAIQNGKFPFKGEDRQSYAQQAALGEYELNGAVLPDLAAITVLLLQKEEAKRPSFGDLIAAFDTLIATRAPNPPVLDLKLSNKAGVPSKLLEMLSPGVKKVLKEVIEKENIEAGNGGKPVKSGWSRKQIIGLMIGGAVLAGIITLSIFMLRKKKTPETGVETGGEERTAEVPLDVKTTQNGD